MRRPPPANPSLPIVCIDFDGVLAESTWPSPAIGAPIPAGLALVRRYAEEGNEVVILTARPESHWPNIVDWLEAQGVGELVYDVTDRKRPASLYIDDRAVAFPLVDIELAWAAGFFDGEGSVTHHKEGRPRKDGTQRTYPKLYAGNTDRRLLERFRDAVGEGRIYGPYGRFDRQGKEIKPMFHWVASHKSGREAAKLLLPLLSPEKQGRVELAFGGEWIDGRRKA